MRKINGIGVIQDEDQLWQQAHAMSIEDGNPGTLRAADAELLKAVADEVEFGQ
jgi:hypothetical protein